MADERLQGSGMKISEAIKRASRWWDATGRHECRKVANKERVGEKFIAAGKAPGAAAIKIQGEQVDVIPSGILRGLEWDRLNKREQLQVVKIWHADYCRKAIEPGSVQTSGIITPQGGSNAKH